MRLCPKCNIECKKEQDKCPICGSDIIDTDHSTRVAGISLIKIPKKVIAIALSSIGVSIAVILVAAFIIMKIPASEPALYIKDGDLCICIAEEDPVIIEKDIFKDLSDETVETAQRLFQRYTYFDRERGIIVYPAEFDIEEDVDPEVIDKLDSYIYDTVLGDSVVTKSFSIKVSDLSGNTKAVTKKAFDLHYIEKDGTVLYREKDRLYSYSVTEDKKKKLCDDIFSVRVNEESGNFMAYTEAEGDSIVFGSSDGVYDTEWDYDILYDSVLSLTFSQSLGSMAYVNDEKELYFVTPKDGERKVADGVAYVYSVYDTGEIYYSRNEVFVSPYSDFVEDDVKDDALPEAKTKAEEIRSWMAKEEGPTFYKVSLYYCDKNKEYELTDKGVSISYMGQGSTLYSYLEPTCEPLMFYNRAKNRKPEKLSLSNLLNMHYPKEYIKKHQRDALIGETENLIAYKENVVKSESFTDVYSSLDGEKLYFIQSTRYAYCNVYSATVKEGRISAPELAFEKVYNVNTMVLEDGELLYFKNYGNHNKSGEMYIGDELIDKDVRAESVFELGDTLYWLCDYDRKTDTGTLMMLKNGETKPVAYKVSEESIRPAEKGVFYTVTAWEKDIVYYFGGKKIKPVCEEADMLF